MLRASVLFCTAITAASIALHTATDAREASSQPHRIEVIAKKFAFVPSEITLKRGQPVTLVLQSEDVLHGLRFKELGLDEEIRKGSPSEMSFTPDKTGTFVGRCSRFCGRGHGQMTLVLHVTE